jgi:hypothetical protein
VNRFSIHPTSELTIPYSGVYAAIVISHAVVCCLGTRVLARLQSIYIALNVLYVPHSQLINHFELNLVETLPRPYHCIAGRNPEGIQE